MKKVINMNKFEYTFPKNMFVEDISRILFVYMIIMIIFGLIRIIIGGLYEGLLILLIALCLFFGWLIARYYLKYNCLKIKKGLILIDKNGTVLTYDVDNIEKIEYVKYDKLIFGRLPQYIFYMADGIKCAIDYNQNDENSVIAMKYVLDEYKDNKKEVEKIDCRRNYFREILILLIAIVIVLTIKLFFA